MTPSFKTESASEPSSAEPKTPAATAGQLLREARQKAGIQLAVLSVTLKVPVRQLEALEADETSILNGFMRRIDGGMMADSSWCFTQNHVGVGAT